MRLVLDTNVVASALFWDGPPRQLLHVARRDIQFFTSAPLLAELTDILSRPKFQAKIAASQLTIDQLVNGYSQLAFLVRPIPTGRVAPDPDDDIVIGTALAARADLIVTGDRTLRAVELYEGVRFLSVTSALAAIVPA